VIEEGAARAHRPGVFVDPRDLPRRAPSRSHYGRRILPPRIPEPVAVKEPQQHGYHEKDSLIDRPRQRQQSERAAPPKRSRDSIITYQKRGRTKKSADEAP
jgi:hypothetical protein